MKVALVVAAMAVAVATAQQSIDKVYFPENETSILDFANRASFDEVVTPDPLGVSYFPNLFLSYWYRFGRTRIVLILIILFSITKSA